MGPQTASSSNLPRSGNPDSVSGPVLEILQAHGPLVIPGRPPTIRALDIVKFIISGGQSGVDRAALDLALELGIPCGGWCPKGARAEDGPINPAYKLKETRNDTTDERTTLNVRDSDGTLIIAENQLVRGTFLTLQRAVELGRPHLIVFVDSPLDPAYFTGWIADNLIATLNVAGPRESDEAGAIYPRAKELLRGLLLGEINTANRRTTFRP